MADKNLNSITFPGLPDKYKVAQVADEYSSSSTYAVGDIVNYLGTTYRCTTAITTEENWTAGHWIPVKIADEVTNLKSAFESDIRTIAIYEEKYIEVNANTVGAIVVADGHYISNQNGEMSVSTDPYKYLAYKVPTDCSVYAVTDSIWHQIGIYSDSPFGSSTGIAVYGGNIPLPTPENPLIVSGGNYVVVVQKDERSGFKIFYSYEQIASINESTMLPNTNDRLDALENDDIGNVDTQMQGLLYRKALPDYYFATPNTPSSFADDEYMLSRLAQVPEGKHFIFVTDTHWDGSYNGIPNNTKHSNYMIQFIRNRLGNIPVVFGGDVINANPTGYQAAIVARKYINECVDSYGSKFIGVLGNHDTNVIGQTGEPVTYEVPYSVIQPIFTENLIGTAVFRDEMESILAKTSDPDLIEQYNDYFKLNYVVNTHDGITFIVINTGAHGSFVRENFGINGVDEIYLHQKWLYDVLMHVPDGNDVVLCGHEVTYGIADPLSSWNLRSAILQICGIAAKRKIELYTQAEVITQKTAPWIPSTQYPKYDFTAAPNIGKAFVIGGHWHHDFAVKIGYNGDRVVVSNCNDGGSFVKANGEIPVIQTINDSPGQYRNESASGYTTSPGDFVMEEGTATEEAFDVVTITSTGIVTTRFGAAEKPSYMQRVFLQS